MERGAAPGSPEADRRQRTRTADSRHGCPHEASRGIGAAGPGAVIQATSCEHPAAPGELDRDRRARTLDAQQTPNGPGGMGEFSR